MSGGLIDVNVYLSRWPFRRVFGDEPRQLAKLLEKYSVASAWTGSFDGLLHKDIAGVNNRLVQDCTDHGGGLLRPFGCVNPRLPDWEEDLRRCADVHGMRGIRLHPNYHGYALDDAAFLDLLQAAAERKLLVQIAVAMEDERMMHPLVQVPHVDVTPLAKWYAGHEGPRVVLLNAFRAVSGEALAAMAGIEQVSLDIAWIEGAEGIARTLKTFPESRLLFGSYAPLFYFESAKLKMQESVLTDEQSRAIQYENAKRLMAE